jgi:glycosyltransferase involved in cell wall biosynthesis
MIRAYRPVASAHPDWRLHIYGHGEQRAALAGLIAEHGLGERVHLMGFTQDFRSVLENASIYAMSSRAEGFPMVLLEAMSTGLPLVSFDCPRGPGEIIDDGKNGRLVPNGDEPGFTAALLELIGDAELRKRLGARALEDSRQYEMDRVVAHWETLFERTVGGRRG